MSGPLSGSVSEMLLGAQCVQEVYTSLAAYWRSEGWRCSSVMDGCTVTGFVPDNVNIMATLYC